MSKLFPKLIETDFGAIHIEKHPQLGQVIHCDITEWTPSIYKMCKYIWKEISDGWKNRGMLQVYAARKPDDEKLKKFAEKFGFEDTELSSLDSEGKVRRIMVYNTGDK